MKAVVLEIERTIRRNASQIQTAKIGAGYALFGSSNGAIVMTDELGWAVLCFLQSEARSDLLNVEIQGFFGEEMKPSREEAAQIGSAIIEGWSRAGLFEDRPREFPNPPGPPGNVFPYQLFYRSKHGDFSLRTDDAHLAKELDIILESFQGDGSKTSSTNTFQCSINSQGELEVFYDHTPIWSRTDRNEARFLILKEAAQSLSGHKRVGAVLHGAAVRAPNGGVLIFIGKSGSGKSTLALGLVSQGWHLLADDHIPISKDGGELISFPTATAVKRGSMELAETKALRAAHEMVDSSRNGVSYLSLQDGVSKGIQLPITAVIVPFYGSDLGLSLERLTPEDAFFACIDSGARPCRHDPQINALASLCNDVSSYRLEFGTSKQSLGACESLVGDV